jgi:hypothetical protein
MSKDMWKDAPKWAMWAAMDDDGRWYWYKNKPIADECGWFPSNFDVGEYTEFDFSMDRANDYRESLTPRPDNFIEDMWPKWNKPIFPECFTQPEIPREAQIGGNHYKKMVIQPVEYIAMNGLSFLQGSVIKYVSRYKAKGGLQDLEKAKHCIDLMIEFEYGNTTD